MKASLQFEVLLKIVFCKLYEGSQVNGLKVTYHFVMHWKKVITIDKSTPGNITVMIMR